MEDEVLDLEILLYLWKKPVDYEELAIWYNILKERGLYQEDYDLVMAKL